MAVRLLREMGSHRQLRRRMDRRGRRGVPCQWVFRKRDFGRDVYICLLDNGLFLTFGHTQQSHRVPFCLVFGYTWKRLQKFGPKITYGGDRRRLFHRDCRRLSKFGRV